MAYRKTDREIERLQSRRDRVVAAVAVVGRGGFGAARARIAKEAGVSVGFLYLRFDGLDHLHAVVLRTLAERELRRVAGDVEAAESPRVALAALFRGFAEGLVAMFQTNIDERLSATNLSTGTPA